METSPYQMRCKAVVSGEVVEFYFYEVPIECGRKPKLVEKPVREEKQEKELDNILRARQSIRRIIWSNQGQYTKFVTLTYKDTVLDVVKVRRDITTFVQNMRRKGYPMKYLYVLEHQTERGKREGNTGCLHVHMLIFIDQYIPVDDLNRAWKHGHVSIEAIKDVRNLGAYVCKYITKENLTEFGKHAYACSLRLDRPSQERFYALGFSDSFPQITPEKILNEVDITYTATMRHDYFDNNGETGMQIVRYYQGKWRNGNPLDPLEQFKRKMDEYDI